MHELSLAAGVLRVVEDALKAQFYERVGSVTLDVGSLSGVEIAALRFALESMSAGTVLEGAQIDIFEVPASAWCMPCAAAVTIRTRLDDCPQCGSRQLQPLTGTELKVRELRVIDAALANDEER